MTIITQHHVHICRVTTSLVGRQHSSTAPTPPHFRPYGSGGDEVIWQLSRLKVTSGANETHFRKENMDFFLFGTIFVLTIVKTTALAAVLSFVFVT